jgi:FkbM family methyltransferase
MRAENLLPLGVANLLDYRRRFSRLGLSSRLSLHRSYRRWLEISRIELLPRDLLALPECVVDVGAGIGEWSMAVARLTNAKNIYAFEPNPDVFARLQQYVQGCPQIRCSMVALGASTGQVTLNVESVPELSSVLLLRNDMRQVHGSFGPSKQVLVPMTTLDQQLHEWDEITLLKIDVQGYESQVLAGARQVLRRTRTLMIEITYVPYYQGDCQFDSLFHLITSMSELELYGISAPHCSADGRPLWADAIFVRGS